MYSASIRIITGIVGVLMILFAGFLKINGDGSTANLLVSLFVLVVGIYFIIAAIKPHRVVNESVGGDLLWALPIRFLAYLGSHIKDLFLSLFKDPF